MNNIMNLADAYAECMYLRREKHETRAALEAAVNEQAAEIEAEIELRRKAEQGLVDWRVKYTELQAEIDRLKGYQARALELATAYNNALESIENLKELAGSEGSRAVKYQREKRALQAKLDATIQSSAHWQHQCTELQAKLFTAPKVGFHEYELEMPQGDNRKARIRWTESVMGASTTKHHLCISVDATPKVAQPLPIARLREIERNQVYNNTATLIDFARAIEKAHGIGGQQP